MRTLVLIVLVCFVILCLVFGYVYWIWLNGLAPAVQMPLAAAALPPPVEEATATPDSIEPATPVSSSTPVPPTATPEPAASTSAAAPDPAISTPASTTGTSAPIVTLATQGWDVAYYVGATDQMRGWMSKLKGLDPENWPEFPNVDNNRVGFLAANGLEYAEDETGYCEQAETCDLVVPPLHYRLVSGDFDLGFDSCSFGANNAGCGFIAINVGEVSTGLEDISVDFGFTVWGRYWNGDEMDQPIWGALSYMANNMLNLESGLNPSPLPNAGGNRSSPEGCEKVRLAFYILSGNELLVKGVTTVTK